MSETENLLKRREELIKAKQEIERKLKLAVKIKNKDESENTLTTINEDEEEENRCDSVVFDMKWDYESGRLAVLKSNSLHIKSLVVSDTSDTKVLVLPKKADKDTKLILENGGIGLTYNHNSCIFYAKEWHHITEKLISLNRHSLILFNDIEKKIKVVTWPGKEVLHEIDDIERIFKSTEIKEQRENLYKDDILVFKSDGSLTLCNLRTFDETVYIPISSSPKSSFNPKQIVYYNHDTDVTLFLVLFDHVIGKLRVLVCGVDHDGAAEVASIPIPKDNLFLKVINPFITYQDSSRTVHILSLFTLAKEAQFDLDDKILTFCMLNTTNFIFNLVNGDFIHFNL